MRNAVLLTPVLLLLFTGCRQTPKPAAESPAAEKPASQMVPLFNGRDLDNFHEVNGTATYKVVDGMIVGTTAKGSPNSFLATKKEYGDFILEFDVLDDPVLNSGVQIRSHQYAEDTTVTTKGNNGPVQRKHKKGRVYGPQVEISNEKAGTSGGIYEEARRGWLVNIKNDPSASKAFKDNQWNHYRVEARGPLVQTFVNGIPCAYLTDSDNLTGFIAFQVHQFKGDKPAQVRFKNVRIQEL